MSNASGVGTPVKILISPTETLNFGGQVRLTPTLTDIQGTPQPAIFPFTFSSSNDALATVDSSGLVTATTPADTNALNSGGVVEISVRYPFANNTNGSTISAVVVVTVLADAARTQAVVITGDTQYSRPAISLGVNYKVIPASAPEPEYPSNWVITNN